MLANDLINRGGPAFVTPAAGRDRPQRRARSCGPLPWCATASTCRRSIAEIDALDNKIDGQLQLDLYGAVVAADHIASAWDLKNGDETPTARRADRGAAAGAPHAASPRSLSWLPAAMQERIRAPRRPAGSGRRERRLAARLSRLDAVASWCRTSRWWRRKAKADIVDAAKAFFAVTEAFRIGRIEDAARGLSPSDYYDGLALSRAQDTIAAARRGMAIAALKGDGKAKPAKAPQRLANRRSGSLWLDAGGDRIGRTARPAAGAHRRRRHHRVTAVVWRPG